MTAKIMKEALNENSVIECVRIKFLQRECF